MQVVPSTSSAGMSTPACKQHSPRTEPVQQSLPQQPGLQLQAAGTPQLTAGSRCCTASISL